ncbi:MAG: iron-containing alcohol dehydrogenase family protein [Eubacteriales bacterium]
MPVKIIYGAGSVEKLESVIDSLGLKKGILVSDKFLVDSGMAQKIVEYSNGKLVEVFSDIVPNPTVDSVDECAKIIREKNLEFAVALGGGSSLDCAKAACAIAKSNDSIRDYHTGGKVLSKSTAIPLIAVPTTAGTGSEVTKVAVLSDPSKNMKAPMGSPVLYAKIALVDSKLTLSVPKSVTASTGLDVLSHALGAFWNKHHQPICDAFALASTRLVFQNVEKVYNEPNNLEARDNMMLASLLAGLAFGTPGTTAPHACSFPLTNDYHLPHGEACAFTLDYFLRLNADVEGGRLHKLAQDCGFKDAFAMADELLRLKKAMGMKTTLREAGVKEEDIENLANHSTHPNIKNNPVDMDHAALLKMYKALY